MPKMTTEQRRALYGMASELGIYEKDNKNDNLHALVFKMTAKESISELTPQDANKVISELSKLKDGNKRVDKSTPGMITSGQKKKAWSLMYRLAEFDTEPSGSKVATRLCKIIEKHLGITSIEKDPFRFMTFEQGSTLIEVIKKMVQYEERKVKSKNA